MFFQQQDLGVVLKDVCVIQRVFLLSSDWKEWRTTRKTPFRTHTTEQPRWVNGVSGEEPRMNWGCWGERRTVKCPLILHGSTENKGWIDPLTARAAGVCRRGRRTEKLCFSQWSSGQRTTSSCKGAWLVPGGRKSEARSTKLLCMWSPDPELTGQDMEWSQKWHHTSTEVIWEVRDRGRGAWSLVLDETQSLMLTLGKSLWVPWQEEMGIRLAGPHWGHTMSDSLHLSFWSGDCHRQTALKLGGIPVL